MGFSQIIKPFGTSPNLQEFELVTLQASSSGPQELSFAGVAFTGADEVFLYAWTDCKITIAASSAVAIANFAANKCNKFLEDSYGSVFYEAGKSIWILNDADLEVSGALNVVRYKY